MSEEITTKGYIKAVLNGFAAMDIDVLDLHLKDEYSYQDTTKEVFLGELNNIFKSHFKLGDTSLLIYDGKCNSCDCSNSGKHCYRFVGNKSKNYFDLIFIIEGDDIRDLFDCCNFAPDVDTGELNNSSSIIINDDDKITFAKTPEYWAKLTPALKAYDEIITIPPREVSIEDVHYWLAKHSFTYEKVSSHTIFKPRMKWREFMTLYDELKEISEFIHKWQNELISSGNEGKSISDEHSLINWLLKYEDMYDAVPFDIKYSSFNNPNQKYTELLPLIFWDGTIKSIFKFIDFYSEKYNGMMNKYCIYTSSEFTDISNEDNYHSTFDKIRSLRFHIEHRKLASELGINIHLNILYDPNSNE
jgi:hypothetical protein